MRMKSYNTPEWINLYKEMESLLKKNPEIIIKNETIEIPNEVKSAFYTLFDNIRDSFIESHFAEKLKKAELLSSSYLKIENEIIKVSHLSEIIMSNNLKRFLNNPVDQLRRSIFELLFKLIGREISLDDFQSEALENINSSFRVLYKKGLQKWVLLCLLKQLQPDEFYYLPMVKPNSKQIIKRSFSAKEKTPQPKKCNFIYLEVAPRRTLLTPNTIVHSKKLNKYIAFRTELGRAMWNVEGYSEKRQWYLISSLIEQHDKSEIIPDILIYVDDNLNDIALVADLQYICRPDMIVECLDDVNTESDYVLKRLKMIESNNNMLNPVLGSIVVSNYLMPEEMKKKIGEYATIIKVDYEEKALQHTIEILSQS